ncbi:spore cortex protein YabQ [Clostridium homopropionicum DSM 5847]|uniref:Spore cortex protein YabQ n=1 Tax=Clostridium homopropionicum DSM 5847 TaxID=1121318 RepID=A0A0L6Z735_9CLOT|nr:spore cortex biosynthesis protein YabQ [Clostridium homopropionicum]KOA18772.1 spore cortex protein YabQ [Clostridium homopropionicum DSM 5847]SFG77652.1 spore cortex biosynthesis protein YabQ [Clostridium homopropionicum]
MIISLQNQFNLIIHSILAGIITGVLFDIYRIIRGFENPNRIITFIEDILFWFFAGILVFIFLVYTTYVYVGVYLYLYIALGLYIYLKVFSRYFIRIQHNVFKVSFSLVRITINILLYPIELIFYRIIDKNK